MLAEILLQNESVEILQNAVRAEIKMLNYVIGALGAIVSAFAVMVWNYFRSERQNMTSAIESLNGAVSELKESNEVQSRIIKIIARKTGVEIGD
jgi:hypothetical protein